KDWNGKEDNEVLAEILEQELDFDTIYKKLEEYYKKV
ncbi:dUTPase, partial [Campylobacter coli]|nr:dUTPase [Campylobacter coli]EIS2921585.1 dUTPase [Campylobacter coli]